jgi:hypothetical protein
VLYHICINSHIFLNKFSKHNCFNAHVSIAFVLYQTFGSSLITRYSWYLKSERTERVRSCSTREINLVFLLRTKHPCIFCLLHKGKSLKSGNFYRKLSDKWKAIIFTCEIIINNLTCEIISFISARNFYKALYFI